jgi:hypothetical protein
MLKVPPPINLIVPLTLLLKGMKLGLPTDPRFALYLNSTSQWYCFPMKTVIDAVERMALRKPLQFSSGLQLGTVVDVPAYVGEVQTAPEGRTARLVREGNGRLVAAGETAIDDETVFGLIDAGRK